MREYSSPNDGVVVSRLDRRNRPAGSLEGCSGTGSPYALDIQKTLEDFYFENVRDAVKAANDTIADIKIVLPEDRDIYINPVSAEPINVFALNPKYTFETFRRRRIETILRMRRISAVAEPGGGS